MIYNRIKKIFAEILDVDKEDILPETELTIHDRTNALNIARLIIECERTFKITIHDEDVHTFKTVSDLVDYIHKLQSNNL